MIETVVRCDGCKQVIEPNKGFEIQGNIMTVAGGGFVGLNTARLADQSQVLWEDMKSIFGDKTTTTDVADKGSKVVVRESHYCYPCLRRIIDHAAMDMGVTPKVNLR